jgi:type IV secretory pathway TrbL component
MPTGVGRSMADGTDKAPAQHDSRSKNKQAESNPAGVGRNSEISQRGPVKQQRTQTLFVHQQGQEGERQPQQ